MSKKFYAVHRETGERWKPHTAIQTTHGGRQKPFLVMFDSGYAGVISKDGFYTYLDKLDPKVWKVVVKENILNNKENT